MLALRTGQWQALLVVSPFIVVYLLLLIRGVAVFFSDKVEKEFTSYETTAAGTFVITAVLGILCLLIAWIVWAVRLWTALE